MTQQLESVQEQLRQKDGQLSEATQQLTNVQGQLSELTQQLTNTQRQLQQKDEQNTSLEEQLTAKEQEVNELEISLATTQRALSERPRQQSPDWIIPRDQIQLTEKFLGKGGWGSVFEGKYCGCTVAVKEIYEDLLNVSSPSSSSFFFFFFFTKDERGFAPRTEKVLNENNQKETETKEISGKRL